MQQHPWQHPLTLRFNDRELEAMYRSHRLQGFFRTLDTRYLAAQAVLAAVFFLVQPLLFPSIEFHWANVAYPAVCIVNWLLTSRLLPRPWYERHRHGLQLGFRTLVDCVVVVGLPAWSPPVPVRSLGTFLTHLLLTSGAGTLIWASIGWPLLLQHHIPYNLASAAAFSLLVAPHVCAVVRQNALGAAYVRSSWAALSRLSVLSSQLRALLVTQLSAAAAATSAVGSGGQGARGGGGSVGVGAASVAGFGYAYDAGALHGFVLGLAPGTGGGGGGSSSSGGGWDVAALVDAPAVALVQGAGEEGMCLATVTLAQVLFGFVFPTILVYVLEGYSRDYFQRSVAWGSSGSSSSSSGGNDSIGSSSGRGSGGIASGRGSGDSGGGPGAAADLGAGVGAAGTSALAALQGSEAGSGHAGGAAAAARRTGGTTSVLVDAAPSPAAGAASGLSGPDEEPSSRPPPTPHPLPPPLPPPAPPAPPAPPPPLDLSSSERWLCGALDWLQRALCGFMLALLVLMLWELLLHLRFLLLPQLQALLRAYDAAAAAGGAGLAGTASGAAPGAGAAGSAGLSAAGTSARDEASALASAVAAAAEAAVAAGAREL